VPREIEIKLRVEDLGAVRWRLGRLGFRRVTARLLERNLVLDTVERRLRGSGQLLRLRSVGSRWWLTYKGPTELGARHKIREEREIETGDGTTLGEILGQLGYGPVFEYQKYRTEYRRAGSRGKVLVDETPIGNYVELEGAAGWIDRTAREMGYGPPDYILESYGNLYLAWCRERGVAPAHMVFGGKKSLLGPAG